MNKITIRDEKQLPGRAVTAYRDAGELRERLARLAEAFVGYTPLQQHHRAYKLAKILAKILNKPLNEIIEQAIEDNIDLEHNPKASWKDGRPKRPLWYAAKHKDAHRVDILKAVTPPTAANYPKYSFMWGGYRTREGAEQVAEYQGYTVHRNDHHIHSNPKRATKIYGRVEEIKATKDKNSLWAGQKFKHTFSSKDASVYGLPDGSLQIKSDSGKRLWKNFKGYKKDVDY